MIPLSPSRGRQLSKVTEDRGRRRQEQRLSAKKKTEGRQEQRLSAKKKDRGMARAEAVGNTAADVSDDDLSVCLSLSLSVSLSLCLCLAVSVSNSVSVPVSFPVSVSLPRQMLHHDSDGTSPHVKERRHQPSMTMRGGKTHNVINRHCCCMTVEARYTWSTGGHLSRILCIHTIYMINEYRKFCI